MKRIIPILLIAVFLISLASADELQTFKSQQSYDVAFICTINNQLVSSAGGANITLFYPNGTIFINNSMALRNSNYFFVTVSPPNGTIPGTYHAVGDCSDQGYRVAQGFDYIVSGSGTTITSAQSTIYVLMLIFSFIIFIGSFYGAKKVPWKNTKSSDGKVISINDAKYFKLFMVLLTYLLGMWCSWLAFQVSYSFLPENIVTNIFRFTWSLLIYSLLPLCFALFGFWVLNKLSDKREWKKMKVLGGPYLE